jgi:hypothetical protein
MECKIQRGAKPQRTQQKKKGTPQPANDEISEGVGLVEMSENNTAGTATRSMLVFAATRPGRPTAVSSEGRTASLLFLNSRGNTLTEQIELNQLYEPCHTFGFPEQGYGKPRRH